MSYPTYLPTIGNSLGDELDDQLSKAITKHKSFGCAHEGYAVLLEELDELWDEVKASQPPNYITANMRKEALHVAVTAIRFIQDVCDKPRTCATSRPTAPRSRNEQISQEASNY